MLTGHQRIRVLRSVGTDDPFTARQGSAPGILRAEWKLDGLGRLLIVMTSENGAIRALEAMLDLGGDVRPLFFDADQLDLMSSRLSARTDWWLAEIADAAAARAEAEEIHPRVTFADGPDAPFARMDRVLADARRILDEARARRAEAVPCEYERRLEWAELDAEVYETHLEMRAADGPF